MGLKIITHQGAAVAVPDLTVMYLSGAIALGDGSMSLRHTLRDHLAAGARKFILNLAEVTHIDSSGIAELVSAFTTVKKLGGELRLFNPTPRVRQTLELTRIDTVIEVFTDAEALPQTTPHCP